MTRDSSFGNADRHVAIASGEIYPAFNIFLRQRNVRLVAVSRSRGSDGNEMFRKMRRCKHGVDPFNNVSGRKSDRCRD